MLEVTIEELKKATIDFYNITGIKIVLYDENRHVLYSYPECMCAFCGIVRSKPELARKCIHCDNIGFDACDRLRKPYIYKCHMQLLEAMAPIIENGIIIGYMMMGQIMDEHSPEVVKACTLQTAKEYDLNLDQMLTELNNFRMVNDAFISSAVNMMSMCACYLYYNKIIKKRSDLLTYQLTDYIDTHLRDELSIAELCQKLYLSRSKLYQLSVDAFGMGISDYIRKRRLEEAQKLLRDTKEGIGRIAEMTGFQDANYFSRIFKASVGITPGEFRKQNNPV